MNSRELALGTRMAVAARQYRDDASRRRLRLAIRDFIEEVTGGYDTVEEDRLYREITGESMVKT